MSHFSKIKILKNLSITAEVFFAISRARVFTRAREISFSLSHFAQKICAQILRAKITHAKANLRLKRKIFTQKFFARFAKKRTKTLRRVEVKPRARKSASALFARQMRAKKEHTRAHSRARPFCTPKKWNTGFLLSHFLQKWTFSISRALFRAQKRAEVYTSRARAKKLITTFFARKIFTHAKRKLKVQAYNRTPKFCTLCKMHEELRFWGWPKISMIFGQPQKPASRNGFWSLWGWPAPKAVAESRFLGLVSSKNWPAPK